MINKYDPTLLHLDYFNAGTWLPLNFATVNYSASYNPDTNRTLILGSETLTFTLSGAGPKALLPPLKTVRLKYSTKLVGSGYFTVDSYRRVYSTDVKAERRGQDFWTVASCSAVAAYAAALSINVTYNKTRPAGETAIQFISQWVNVENWEQWI